jgi:UDP-N-acetylmuramoylalanine--D-glutamate ligase
MTENVRGKTILVVGLARSGCAVGSLLRRHGARVLGVDDADSATLQDLWRAEELTESVGEAFDELHAGDWSFLAEATVDAVALSPGVPLNHPRVAALAREVPVWGELEWGSRFFTGDMVAVTGTNGKSTVTELTAHLARATGRSALALGNVGRPFSLEVDRLGPDDLVVLEVSSFQLETIASFRPRVGVVLNLDPDHLDRYPDLAAYYAAKRRLAEAVAPGGRLVTWTGCHEARGWVSAPLLFGAREEGAAVFWEAEQLWLVAGDAPQALIGRAELALNGKANERNAAAAVAALLALAPDPERLARELKERLAAGLRSFRGLPHRQQTVAHLDGVRFVDDSKATNVSAVRAGLAGHASPLVLIAGGRGKGEDYQPLREEVAARVTHVLVIGEEGPAMARALGNVVPVEEAACLEEAVARAAELARPSGTVLLSPACASFDMFRNYHERGEAFARAALALGAVKEGGG